MTKTKPRSKFADILPLDRSEVLKALQDLNQKRAGLDAEIEGRAEELKQVKAQAEQCTLQIYSVLSAVNNDRPVYRLKDGTVTTDAPDPQGELVHE